MPHDIRIAFITPEAPPFSGGGIATFINNITRGLHRAGVFCEVFAPSVNAPTEVTEQNGVVFHRIHTTSVAQFTFDVVPYFLQRHNEKHFTIAESCEIHAALYELQKQRITGLKYVIRVQMPGILQSHLNYFYESKWRKLRYVLGAFRRGRWDLGFWNRVDVKRFSNREYLSCEMADHIIAPSYSFKEWLGSFWRLPPDKISVIPHLFDFETLIPGEKIAQEKLPGDMLTVLFVGKLNAHKGVINLARAASRILKRNKNVQFILIGEDWDIHYGRCKTMTGTVVRKLTYHDERVRLTGKVPYEELYRYLSNADIVVLPSLWEAWGYTCTEAMSMGKPVIGSRYGGMADAITDGKDGMLVDPHDVKELERKMEVLIGDEQLRKRLGNEAKKTIETKLEFGKLVKESVGFYKRLLAVSTEDGG